MMAHACLEAVNVRPRPRLIPCGIDDEGGFRLLVLGAGCERKSREDFGVATHLEEGDRQASTAGDQRPAHDAERHGCHDAILGAHVVERVDIAARTDRCRGLTEYVGSVRIVAAETLPTVGAAAPLVLRHERSQPVWQDCRANGWWRRRGGKSRRRCVGGDCRCCGGWCFGRCWR